VDRVCAVIVTHNRKELLRECLRAVLAQTRPVDHILVVDNASTDGTADMLREEFSQVEVLRLPENQGGAGGFHEGMKRAYELGYEWMWLMDDDALPSRTALEELLLFSEEADVVAPGLVNRAGVVYGAGNYFLGYRPLRVPFILKDARYAVPVQLVSFVGPLISRRVVESVGFPRVEFFIWADDWEYFLRVHLQGMRTLWTPCAAVFHEYGGEFFKVKRFGWTSIRPKQPAWKYYYSTRNTWVMLGLFPPFRRYLERLVYLVYTVRWMLGDVLFEENYMERCFYRVRGLWDGIWGRLGRIV